MREYTLIFKDGLKTGLRHSDKAPINAQSLTQAQGAMQDSGSLVNLDDLSTLDLSILNCTYPFPQIFQLINFTIICTPTKIYTYNGSLTLRYTAAQGSTWTVADFHNYLVFTNGKELITLDPSSGAWAKYIGSVVPNCLCVCELNGQLIVGGPDVTISSGFLG